MSQSTSGGRNLVWSIVVVLFIIHQDFWWWDDPTLVFDFLPIGLFYHALFSVAAGLTWALANKFAWPDHIEEWASEETTPPVPEGGVK